MCESHGWPDSLSEFGTLAHDQQGHEELGIAAESVVPEILEAARKLLESESPGQK